LPYNDTPLHLCFPFLGRWYTYNRSHIICGSCVFTIVGRGISIKASNAANEVCSLVSKAVGPLYITSIWFFYPWIEFYFILSALMGSTSFVESFVVKAFHEDLGFRFRFNSSYHTYISFILSPLSYNITYSPWLATSYNHPFFTVLVWSYHWQFTYAFAMMPLWEWTYNNPRHTSRYYYNYCLGKWNMCSKGGLPPFPSPHPMTNGYPYHKRRLLNFDGHCHCWINSHKYGSTNIDDNNTCSDDGSSREDMIIHRMDTKQWLHSLHCWDIWVSLFPFRFISNHLSTNHYSVSSTIF
jgi:hypothetical protein